MTDSAVAIAEKDEIVIKGSHFFFQNGTQFFIRGVVYSTPSTRNSVQSYAFDPLDIGQNANCKSDIPLLLSLGINAVFASGLHYQSSHKDCMEAFQTAGIYVLVDLAAWDFPEYPRILVIGSDGIVDPLPSWNGDIWTAYTTIVDELAGYSNVLGFVAAQGYSLEFVRDDQYVDGLPLAKAAVRDLKAYMTEKKYRNIPVGFLGENHTVETDLGASYLNCGNVSESIDFWAISVDWCGNDTLSSIYVDFELPVFMGAYYCFDDVENFTEVGELYRPEMTKVFSGGFYDSWYDDLVEVGEGSASGTVNLTSQYTSISKVFATISPSATQSASYTPTTLGPKTCPTSDIAWPGLKTLAPAPNEALCQCMYSSLTCTVPEGWKPNSWSWSNVTAQNWTAYVGVQVNGTNATYGAYSVCKEFQRVSWSINQLYMDNKTLGHTATCNSITNGNLESPAPVQDPCSTMLAAAGPLGDHVVVPSATASYFGSEEVQGGDSGLSGGAIAGIVIGVIIAAAISAASALLWWKRRKAKTKPSPDGLEVAVAPNAELSGDVPTKSELWTNRNTVELPGSEGVKASDAQNRGSYAPVENQIPDEATELDSNSQLSPSLANHSLPGRDSFLQSTVSRSNSYLSPPLSSNSPGAGPESPQDMVSRSNSYLIPFLGNNSSPRSEGPPMNTGSPRISRISSISTNPDAGLDSHETVSPTSQNPGGQMKMENSNDQSLAANGSDSLR